MKHVSPLLPLAICIVLMGMIEVDIINEYVGIAAMFITVVVFTIFSLALNKRKKRKGTSFDSTNFDSGSNRNSSNSSWSSDYSDSDGGDCGGGDCGCD